MAQRPSSQQTAAGALSELPPTCHPQICSVQVILIYHVLYFTDRYFAYCDFGSRSMVIRLRTTMIIYVSSTSDCSDDAMPRYSCHL